MKNYSKYNTLQALVLGSTALLCSQNSYTDDIDIYTSITNGSNTAVANHNILFVMDTSGSMNWSVPGLSTNGTYDATQTYGTSSDSDIYVYDSSFNYTGVVITPEQNQCQGITNAFASHPSYPVYLDKAFQWHQIGDLVPVPCEGTEMVGGTVIAETTIFVSQDENRTNFINKQAITAGTDYKITVTTDKKAQFRVETDGSDGSNRACNLTLDNSNDRTYTCEGTFGPSDDEFTFSVKTKRSDTNISYSVSYGGTLQPKTCVIPPSPVTSNDWSSTLINSSNDGTILECERDGADDQKYVVECPANTECTEPTYQDAVNTSMWTNNEQQFFFSGNFHDYFTQATNIDLTGLSQQDAQTYCGGRNDNNNGDEFIDSATGLVTQCFRRLDVMKDAVGDLVTSLAGEPINIGLMRFNTNNKGGAVIDAIQNIATNADFSTKLNALPASGGTPLSEVLYEAYNYMGGKTPVYGLGDTDTTAKTGSDYKTPITSSCQSNNIILLTDGEPSVDNGKNETIKNLSAAKTCVRTFTDATTEQTNDYNGNIATAADSIDNDVQSDNSELSNGVCLDEMAEILATTDNNLTVPEDNFVNTYTIGLTVDLELLKNTARYGKGEYFSAASLGDLEAAFSKIVVTILEEGTAFVAPAVSVNAFNELQHRQEIYYALFKPQGTPRWPGNIKKYTVSSSGDILDVNSNPAINTTTGFFDNQAQSIWSTVKDGNNVVLGGASESLTNARNIYTENNSDTTIKLATSNFSDIDFGQFAAGSDAEKDDILQWFLGVDVFDDDGDLDFTDEADFLADPLHSRPTVITYAGTSAAPEEVLFYSTNLGTLHAIDPKTGGELWAYLPKEHQSNLKEYISAPNSDQHVYGLDGEMTITRTEDSGSTSTSFELDSVQLFLGERRGGSNYYGFDVSNARIKSTVPLQLDNSYDTPLKELWSITGRTPNIADDVETAGFSDLGQTWSRMVPATLTHSGGKTEVLIFSGGYDTNHDTLNHTSTDPVVATNIKAVSDLGNAIYVVDKSTGDLIYSIGNNDDDESNGRTDTHKKNLPMQDSIPASPTVIDTDGDGDADMIFAIDIAGHIWRLDLDETQSITSNDLMKGGLIADLSEPTAQRRFYNSLDISRSNTSSGSNHLTLVVGSGYRASPSIDEANPISGGDSWNNRIYFIHDDYISERNLNSAQESDRYKYVTSSSSVSRTIQSSDISETTPLAPLSKQNAAYGFYVELSDGEKALQKPLTFNNVVLISTFSLENASTNPCGGSLGSGRVYALDVNTGISVLRSQDPADDLANYNGTLDTNGDPVDADGNPIYFDANGHRIVDFYSLDHQGIPAETTLLLLP